MSFIVLGFRTVFIGLGPYIFLPVCSGFKKRAPKAIKEIRKFAHKTMGTKDVRIDSRLNKHVWSCGIRSVGFSSALYWKAEQLGTLDCKFLIAEWLS